MKCLTQARLRIQTPTRHCNLSSRNKVYAPTSSRPTLTTPFLHLNTHRQPFRTISTQAGRNPNPFGPNSDGESAASQILDLALPAAGVFAIVLFLGPFLGSATAIFGLPLAVTAIAAVLGFLNPLAALLGTSPLVAAGVVAGSTFGILLIPAFLKFGLFAFAGLFVANLVFGGIASLSGKDVDSNVGGGGGGFANSRTREPEIDARNAIIDVEAKTIDDP